MLLSILFQAIWENVIYDVRLSDPFKIPHHPIPSFYSLHSNFCSQELSSATWKKIEILKENYVLLAYMKICLNISSLKWCDISHFPLSPGDTQRMPHPILKDAFSALSFILCKKQGFCLVWLESYTTKKNQMKELLWKCWHWVRRIHTYPTFRVKVCVCIGGNEGSFVGVPFKYHIRRDCSSDSPVT